MNKNEEYLYEWDVEKNRTNIKKHGISFKDAAVVFSDPYRIDLYDFAHSYYEDRFIIIGSIGKIVVVVYTMRQNNIRIISARKANSKERSLYYGNSLLHSIRN